VSDVERSDLSLAGIRIELRTPDAWGDEENDAALAELEDGLLAFLKMAAGNWLHHREATKGMMADVRWDTRAPGLSDHHTAPLIRGGGLSDEETTTMTTDLTDMTTNELSDLKVLTTRKLHTLGHRLCLQATTTEADRRRKREMQDSHRQLIAHLRAIDDELAARGA
jgi:hypothetical protein